MPGRDDPLAFGDKFLIKLFTGAQAGVADLDINIRFLARQADHVPGHLVDSDRLAHLEEEDLAVAAHRPGLEDELGRLLDRHEIAGDLGVGDGDRAAELDLALEQRQHRAGRAEDVAEAHRHEPGVVVRRLGPVRRRFRRLRHPPPGRAEAAVPAVAGIGQHQQFGQPFRGPHDVGRPHRLVGGDQDEALDPVADDRLDQQLAGEDIVVHRLPGVVLDQGHMLVGGGMEDDLRPVAAEDHVEQAHVLDLAEHRHGIGDLVFMEQFHLDGVEVFLAAVEQDQPGRGEADDLAAQFGADRAAGPGDEDRLAPQGVADSGLVEGHLLPAEQILVRDIADRRHRHPAVYQLAEAGQHLVRQAGLLAQGDDPLHLGPGEGDDGDQQFVGPRLGGEFRQVVDPAEHRDAVDPQPGLGRIVIDEADHLVGQGGVVVDLPRRLLGRVAGADHQQPLEADYPVFAPQGVAVEGHADRGPAAADEQDGEHRVHDEHPARIAMEAIDQGHDRDDDRRRHQGGADDPLQVAEAGIAPHAVIEAEQVEDRQLDCEDDEQDGDVVVGALGEMQGVEAEVAGEEIGGYEQGDVGCQDQPEVEAEAAAPQPAEVLVELGSEERFEIQGVPGSHEIVSCLGWGEDN